MQINKEISTLIVQKMKESRVKCILHYFIFYSFFAITCWLVVAEVPYQLPILSGVLAFASAFLTMFFFQDVFCTPSCKSSDNLKKIPIFKMTAISLMVITGAYLATLIIPSEVTLQFLSKPSMTDIISVDSVGGVVVATLLCSILPIALAFVCVSSLVVIDSEFDEKELNRCVISLMWDVVAVGAFTFVIGSFLSGILMIGLLLVGVIPAVAGSYAYVKGFRPKADEKVGSKVIANTRILA